MTDTEQGLGSVSLWIALATFLCCAPLWAGGLSIVDRYGPDGLPFTADDPLEARANVWGAKVVASGWDRWEEREIKFRDKTEADYLKPSKTPEDPLGQIGVFLVYLDPNFGPRKVDLGQCQILPPAGNEGGAPMAHPWKNLARPPGQSLEGFLVDGDVRDISKAEMQAVWNDGNYLEFNAPGLASVCYQNAQQVGIHEDSQDFGLHIKANFDGDPAEKRIDEPEQAKKLSHLRLRNVDFIGTGAALYNNDTRNLALSAMFHFDFQGAGLRVNRAEAKKIDLEQMLKIAGEYIKEGGLGGLMQALKDKAEFDKAAADRLWFEKFWGAFTMAMRVNAPRGLKDEIKDGEPVDVMIRHTLAKVFPEMTWLPWKNVSHIFEDKFKVIKQKWEADKRNEGRTGDGLYKKRDRLAEGGFVWNKGACYRTWNAYIGSKRRDEPDVNAENDWVDVVDDVGMRYTNVRMLIVDPYRSTAVQKADELVTWDWFPTPYSVGWMIYDLITYKGESWEHLTKEGLLPVPWPFPNANGGQSIILSAAGAGGHYNYTPTAPAMSKLDDKFLPRELFNYVMSYNPFGGPKGMGSIDIWGIEMTDIDSPGAYGNARGRYVKPKATIYLDPPCNKGAIRRAEDVPLINSKGPIRFCDAIVNNGFLDWVSTSRKYDFLWDYDSDGTVDNDWIANTSHNFGQTSVATLFTLDSAGSGRTGLSQVPVYVE